MTIKLVSDSTCDLPASLIKKHNIHIVPISIHFGTEVFLENITIQPEAFYDKVLHGGVFPQTSQPSVGAFETMYRRLAQEQGVTDIISGHVGAKLSGTVQSATLAAKRVADTVTVHVVDSMAGSAGLGFLIAEAGELIERGKSAPEIVAHLEAKRRAISIFLALDNLKFAQMSGRVSKLTGFLSSVLNIKPIVSLNDGLLSASHRARSVRNALKKIVDLTVERVGDQPVHVGITHAVTEERAKILLKLAEPQLNIRQLFVGDLSISVAVHLGPGTVGLVAYPVTSTH